jgi:CBS domain-containing protein
MTPDPVSVPLTATVKQVAEVLIDRDIHSVPVVDAIGRLAGAVSDADLIAREGYPNVQTHDLSDVVSDVVDERRHHWRRRVEGCTAAELMTTPVITCGPGEPVAVATRLLLKHGLRALPVVDGDALVGVVSRHDILHLLARPDAEIQARLAILARDPLWMPEGHAVTFDVDDGVVTASGMVMYERDVRAVLGVVRQIPGVIDVVDQLRPLGPDPKPTYLHDTDFR